MAAQLAALDDGEAGLKKLAEQTKAARGGLCRRRRGAGGGAAQGRGAARQGGVGRARPAQAREGEVRHRARAAAPRPTGPTPAPTACSSRSPPIPARRRRRSPGSPRAASCRASCWRSRSAWPRSATPPPSCSTRSTSGIGGATAAAVGERLKRLAKDVQVLVVTHSPQVAAIADRHWLIRKTTTRTTASTDVAGARRQGPPRGDRPHAVGRRGHRRGARRRRPAAGDGGVERAYFLPIQMGRCRRHAATEGLIGRSLGRGL